MKTGIIGSGIVGRVLGNGFLREGFEVMLGSRTPSKEEVIKWKTQNPTGLTGTFEEAAKFGDILVLATGGKVAANAIELAGKNNFSNKLVIDTTNPLDETPPVNGVLKFFTGNGESLMERLQKIVPQANFVKAFNSVGNASMYQPVFGGIKPTMFICGNNPEAKKVTEDILQKFGWETADMGISSSAASIEALCILWCIPGFLRNEWTHAFKLLKKTT